MNDKITMKKASLSNPVFYYNEFRDEEKVESICMLSFYYFFSWYVYLDVQLLKLAHVSCIEK